MTMGITTCPAVSNPFQFVFPQAIGQNNLTFEMLLSDVSHNNKASNIHKYYHPHFTEYRKKWKDQSL